MLFHLEVSVLFVETGRSNVWKITLFLLRATDFLTIGNRLFLPFWSLPATANIIFPSSGNIFWNVFLLVESDFLSSGNSFFNNFSDISASDLCRYHTFMTVFFLSSENIVLKQILHSGQWKRIFRLVETISFQYVKYSFHWKQFFHLLEISFKRILYYSQWQRISCLLETIFFHSDFFRNHYCNWSEANI